MQEIILLPWRKGKLPSPKIDKKRKRDKKLLDPEFTNPKNAPISKVQSKEEKNPEVNIKKAQVKVPSPSKKSRHGNAQKD